MLSLRQVQRVFVSVANDVESCHARAYIQPVDPHGMVVIPEQRGLLIVRIFAGCRTYPARTLILQGQPSTLGGNVCAPWTCTTVS